MITVINQGIILIFFKRKPTHTNLVVCVYIHTCTEAIPGTINKKLGNTGCLWRKKWRQK